jgi:hypothetical protein
MKLSIILTFIILCPSLSKGMDKIDKLFSQLIYLSEESLAETTSLVMDLEDVEIEFENRTRVNYDGIHKRMTNLKGYISKLIKTQEKLLKKLSDQRDYIGEDFDKAFDLAIKTEDHVHESVSYFSAAFDQGEDPNDFAGDLDGGLSQMQKAKGRIEQHFRHVSKIQKKLGRS